MRATLLTVFFTLVLAGQANAQIAVENDPQNGSATVATTTIDPIKKPTQTVKSPSRLVRIIRAPFKYGSRFVIVASGLSFAGGLFVNRVIAKDDFKFMQD